MKQFFFFFFFSFLIISCSKDDNETQDEITNPNSLTKENIYEQTGCHPIGIENIDKMKLFVDTVNNARYLYGSKKDGEKSNFWVSEFTTNGNYVWEVIKENNIYNSHAYNPVLLNNGNIVIADVLMEDEYHLKTIIPAIIFPSKSTLTYVNVPENYDYSDVRLFDNFFMCTISEQEMDLNPNAIGYCTQILNNGELLRCEKNLNIPDDFSIWKDNDWFICVDFKSTHTAIVKKEYIIPDKEQNSEWESFVFMPSHIGCSIDANFTEDSVSINFNFEYEQKTKDTYNYLLSYNTGDYTPKADTTFEYLELGEHYVAPDSLTVTMNSVIRDGNDVLIYYTLENNTNKVIEEKNFEILYCWYQQDMFQTGTFESLNPGDKINKNYTFYNVSDMSYYIQYRHDFLQSTPSLISSSLKWAFR